MIYSKNFLCCIFKELTHDWKRLGKQLRYEALTRATNIKLISIIYQKYMDNIMEEYYNNFNFPSIELYKILKSDEHEIKKRYRIIFK